MTNIEPTGPVKFVDASFFNPSTGNYDASLTVIDGHISDASSGAISSQTLREVSLGGAYVYPAFRDGHVHPLFAGREAAGPVVTHARSIEEIQSILSEYRAANPAQNWIVGGAYDRSLIESGRFLAEWIDAAISDVPVILHANDHHTIWVNTKALELLPEVIPQLSAGSIDVDDDGNFSGVLREPPAMALVLDRAPKAQLIDEVAALVWADRKLASLGIVQAQDAWITEGMTEVYIAAHQSDQLLLDYNLAFKIDPDVWPAAIEFASEQRVKIEAVGSRQLTAKTVKFFADGVFGSGTASVLEPYLDDQSFGEPLWQHPALLEACLAAASLDFQLHIHAIGDAGVRQALDAVEATQSRLGRPALPSVIAHAELVSKADMPRFAELGVVANMQPLWAQADGMLMGCQPRLGAARISEMYRMRDLLNEGAVLAFGSDWPVSSPDPLLGMATAIFRTTAQFEPQGGWQPHQAVTASEALASYTSNVSYQLGGVETFTPDSSADFVVCDTDLLNASDRKYRAAKVLATYKGGLRIS